MVRVDLRGVKTHKWAVIGGKEDKAYIGYPSRSTISRRYRNFLTYGYDEREAEIWAHAPYRLASGSVMNARRRRLEEVDALVYTYGLSRSAAVKRVAAMKGNLTLWELLKEFSP